MAFTPRTTSYGMKSSIYYHYVYNGRTFNIPLPNCCTYAYGRTMELNCKVNGRDWYAMNDTTSAGNWWQARCAYGNARYWYSQAQSAGLWTVSRTPDLGAIACFNDNNGDGGHVAVVEGINRDGTVNLSFSEYGGRYFVYLQNARLVFGQRMTVGGNVYGFGTFRGYIINPYTAGSRPSPEPTPQPIIFRRGDWVKIIELGNANSYGTGRKAYGIGWKRKILNIYAGRPYPYQVGLGRSTTGFYKASALSKI